MTHNRISWTALVLLAASSSACRLLIEAVIDEGPAAGADAAAVDGADDAPIDCLAWAVMPAEVDVCAIEEPGAALTLTAGTWSFDTNSGALTDPQSNASFPPSSLETFGDGVEVRVVSLEGLQIDSGATLRATGLRPLVIVSWDSMQIDGVVDVSSNLASGVGAGSTSNRDCIAPSAGSADIDGGGGGGGGGLSSAGGVGGSGNLLGATGGGAGQEIVVSSLSGGCGGGPGGNEGTGGRGGAGGGAIALIAQQAIVITGLVEAGGSGGGGSLGSRSGGGGGGSGGVIQLEAPSVELVATARIAANGGGGGGGSDNNAAGQGQDGQPLAQAALGGTKEGKGAAGGDGSDPSGNAASVGGDAERGGGGGGGGAGLIQIRSAGAAVDTGASISPAPGV